MKGGIKLEKLLVTCLWILIGLFCGISGLLNIKLLLVKLLKYYRLKKLLRKGIPRSQEYIEWQKHWDKMSLLTEPIGIRIPKDDD